MKSHVPSDRPTRGGAPNSDEDEELEMGEPIPDEQQPGANGAKILATRRRFSGNPQNSQSTPTGVSTPPPAGQLVLSSAKYLPASALEPEPPTRKQRTAGGTANSGQSFEGKVFGSGVAGGLLAMGGAIVWFVLGLMNDVLFFYPPILFVLGLGAFFKGMTRGE